MAGGDLMVGLYDNTNMVTPPSLMDPQEFYLDPDYDFFATENYANLLPCFSEYPNDPLVPFSDDLFLHNDEFDEYYCQYPKRQKNTYQNTTNNSSYIPYSDDSNGYQVPTLPMSTTHYYPTPDYSQDFLFPPPPLPTTMMNVTNVQIPSNQVYQLGCNNGGGNVTESVKKANVGLSAQSVAARQRRRRITEKTQELGKLIPGGNKMNTAEMLQSAFKYVKFMQAQIAILESLGSIQENAGTQSEKLHVLLSSPTIQEKLYSEEKCLVPKKSVEMLAKDQDIQSSPFISREISLLVSSSN